MLLAEFEYFIKHQDELVKKFNNRFIVIRGQSVVADYADELDAYTESKNKYELGTFLIQRCLPGKEVYTQTYHSRVYIAHP